MKAGSIPLPHRVFSGLYRRFLAMAMVGQAGFCYIASRKKRLVPIPFGSIICIRFNGYNLSLPQMMCGNRHPLRLFLRANIRNKFCSSGISSENFGVFSKISSLGVLWGRRKWQMLPPRVPGISGGGPGTRSESLQHLHAENCTLVRFPLWKCRNEGRRKGGKPSKILTRHCTSKK